MKPHDRLTLDPWQPLWPLVVVPVAVLLVAWALEAL